MQYKILIKDINGTMSFASDVVKDKYGYYVTDFVTSDFSKAKEKFLELLDL